MGLIRDDEADIRFSCNGVNYFDSWATYDGGALTATAAKTRRGGMGRSQSAGGPADRSDIVITIQFDDVVAGFHNQLENLVGNGDVLVSIQYLNKDRTAIVGAHFTRSGVLIGAELPKADGTTDSPGVSMYTVTISADELAS